MFFDSLIRRKLASLIRPWLTHEPDWEVKLGFRRSIVVARNLRFDIDALNRLIDGGDDVARLLFKDVTVDDVTFTVSHWSYPAFTLDVRGLHITLFPPKPRQDGVSERGEESVDDYLEKTKKKILAQIDPGGTMLHDNIQKIMMASTSSVCFRNSVMNLLLMHCCLHLHDACVRAELLLSDDVFSWLCYAREFSAGSSHKQIGCFWGGFIRLLLLPFRETDFKFEAQGLEVGAEKKDHSSCIFSCVNPYIDIRLKDSHLVNFMLSVPELNILFSPPILHMMVASSNALYPNCKNIRSGRLLWKIVRSKILSISLPSGHLLYKVVIVAVLWLRLVKEYQIFLELAGYSKHGMNISDDCKFFQPAKQHWKVISEMEKQLPAEAIVSARHVARYHAALKEPIAESLVSSGLKGFCKILLLMAVIWGAILKTVEILMTLFFISRSSVKISSDQGSTVSVMSNSRCCFQLCFGKISTVLSPTDSTHHPINKIASSRSMNHHKDLSSFCLLVKELLFIYEEGIIEQFMSFSVGFLEGTSVPIFDGSENEIGTRNGTVKDEVVGAKTVVCGNPASLHTGTEIEGGSAAFPSPEQLLKAMKLTSERLHARFNGTDNLDEGSFWALCDIQNFLVYPGLKSPDSGFSKCSLMMGKLNFELGYSSILSIATLVVQMQHALLQMDGSECSAPSRTLHESRKTNSCDDLRSSVKEITGRLFRMIPDEYVELQAIIAGPSAHVSLGCEILDSSMKENAVCGPEEINLTIDAHDSHLFVWPTAESGVLSFRKHQIPEDLESEVFKLQESVSNVFSESDNINYASKGLISLCGYVCFGGLNAYIKDPIENCTKQFIQLKPMTSKFTLLRYYLHIFGESVVGSSLFLGGTMAGGTGLFYMDELAVVLQVVGRFSASLIDASGYRLDTSRHVMVEHQVLHTESDYNRRIVPTNEGPALNLRMASFVVEGSFELGQFDIVLHNSRNGLDREGFSRAIDAYNIRKLGLAELPNNGIWLSFKGACIGISVGDVKAKLDVNLGGFHAIIFESKNQVGNDDNFDTDNPVLHSISCLQEVSVSTSSFILLFDCEVDSGALTGTCGTCSATSGNEAGVLLSDSPSTIDSEGLNPMSSLDEDFSDALAQTPSPWLCINITIDVVFVGTCSVKTGILEAHCPDKLCLSLSIGGDFHRICLRSQGGYVFFETTVLARLTHCFTSYLHCVRVLSSVEYPYKKFTEVSVPGVTRSILHKNDVPQSTQSIAQPGCSIEGGRFELLSVHLSQFSLVLLAADESGLVKEIIGEIDLTMKLWLENRRKFVFNISYLNILSQTFDSGLRRTEKIIQMPHFSSVVSSYDSLWLSFEDSTAAVSQQESSFLLPKDGSSSIQSTSMESSSYDSAVPVIHESERERNYLVHNFAIAISAEESLAGNENDEGGASQGWIGSGSVVGLNVTISLSEIQMLTNAIESLYGVAGKDAAYDVKEKWQSIIQETEKDLETALPEGAVVAIQDVHQHLYVTVESAENKFRIAGALHHSLAGRKALFRVKWQRRRWNFSASCFSLISLFAKSNSGDLLHLNCSSSSGFVEISSINDSSCALWKIVSCKNDIYENDVDLEPLNNLSHSTFYLVNKKNDCGAAFIDGTLEFVKKPGNPFKFKVFDGFPLDNAPTMSESYHQGEHGVSDQDGGVPCINLSIEKASLTIVHELFDAKGKLNLLQGCINGTEVIVQILPQKTRVMSTLTAMLYFFDAHKVIWRQLVHPTEINIYARSRSMSHSVGREISKGMQSLLYIKMRELELSISELSLDTLLFVVGKLDLAGPFSVKNSAILANCCKVENQTELNLFCHFYDGQSAMVGRRQSGTFFLRTLVDLQSEASDATFRLESPEMLSTSSIRVPLAKSQIFSWRTRIMSLRDSRTSPGPFIVYDISKNAEEGLSVVVSPLLKICNQTGFPVELRIQRPEQMEAETASVLLREGEIVDDCMAAFDAINLSGGPKKALLSLGIGNFVLSFRPEIKGDGNNAVRSYSVEWSDYLSGGKAVRLSGVIDKLSYQFRKALSADSWKYSFSTVSCSVGYENTNVAEMHFLLQSIRRDVPIMLPIGDPKSKNLSIALQEQKEVYLLPTVRVSNLLESDIDVLLSDREVPSTDGLRNINQATISSRMTVDLYANPAILFFTITLTMFGSSCKPVNCGDWLKKLKRKDGIQFLDIDLEYCGGKYFACLRLVRGNSGILEAIVFTQYTLRNKTDFPLFCAPRNLKSSSRDEAKRDVSTPPHLGSFLPEKSTRSWFLKSSRLRLELMAEETAQSNLDLDVLSGLAEISFTKIGGTRSKHLIKFGVSLGPLTSKMPVPSQVVSIVPRYVICNESNEQIFARQCFIEDDLDETISLNSKQKKALSLRIGSSDKRDITVLDKLLQKHRMSDDGASTFVQFRPNGGGLGWSGPICVASLGHFFLKFKRSSSEHESDVVTIEHEATPEFASVHVIEEASTFVLHFHRPANIDLPYRIENDLHHASITYYQKDTFDPETLASRSRVNYVWDDLTRPRKLMVKINGINTLREISLDKLRSWKPFFRARHQREFASDLSIDHRIVEQQRNNPLQTNASNVENIGYAVYADGPTRVLRISDSAGICKSDRTFQSCKKIQFRVSYFAIHLLELCKQELEGDSDPHNESTYVPIVVGRLENISLDSIFIDKCKYSQIMVQSINVDEKWVGAPFAAMLRRHFTANNDMDDCTLFIVFVLYPTTSSVQEIKYLSIILQPIDLNLDEETLMRLVPFWRKSLSTSTHYQQYYFDHFEIHPIKIFASFLPVDSYSGYSSGQETLRSLLHSVIKIPAVKNMVVELNGVLVTHALVTTRELMMRCAQHYSWHAMRAIYIAKGSPLLPPTFASVFDDLASSSLDVFFDPSSSLFNVRGLTLGTFKLVSKCIQDKGFSGTKRYFGDLSKTLRNAGSSILFAAVTEISDSILKGAESNGLNGVVTGFHHGILKLAMEPSFLGTAFMEGGPDRKIMLDRSPGVDELYIEGYLQAMLDSIYKQEYLRVRVIDNQVILKNLPPNSSLIGEIMDRVKEFLVSKALLKGDFSASSRPLRHLRGEKEWKIGPTVLTLCEHLFVSFAIRMLRSHTENAVAQLKLKGRWVSKGGESQSGEESKVKRVWRWGVGRFVFSAMVAYIDGRLCRYIPHPIARRIVSGFLLSFLDTNNESK